MVFMGKTTKEPTLFCCGGRNGEIFGDEALDDHDIEPATIELAVFFVNPHFAEASGATDRATGAVEGKYPGDQLPESALACGVNQGREKPCPNPVTS